MPSQNSSAGTTSDKSSFFPLPSEVNCICIGSGRFLRSVLVPALVDGCNYRPVIIQTRGRTFLDYCLDANLASCEKGKYPVTYDVDTVGYSGAVETAQVGCWGAGTLGSMEGRGDVMDLLDKISTISIIGVGVTEAGLSGPDSPSLHHIYEILLKIRSLIASKKLKSPNPTGKICVINTDNVPGNGSIIRKHLVEIAKKSKGGEQSVCETTDSSESDSFIGFLDKHISFHNTMVDRITSQRENSGGMVPRCEPVPAKALVVEDLTSSLPSAFSSDYVKSEFGVVVRKDKGELDFDIVAKLRIANGTHTAVAHTMALSSLLMTDVLARDESYEAATILMKYLDSFVKDQVLASRDMQARTLEAEAAWDDWRRRLCHPAFGLSTFFITQNGEKKGGIRMSPTIKNLMESGNGHVSVAASFAFAALLRFHTPRDAFNANHSDGIYKGWLDSTTEAGTDDVVYADGLRYNLSEGWYEFRGHCKVGGQSSSENASISALLGKASRGDGSQPIVFLDAIKAYLREKDGGNMADCNTLDFENFAISTATLYARMLSDNLLSILKEIASNKDIYTHGFATKCSVLVDGSPIVSD